MMFSFFVRASRHLLVARWLPVSLRRRFAIWALDIAAWVA